MKKGNTVRHNREFKPKTILFPIDDWKMIDEAAKQKGTNTHRFIQQAALRSAKRVIK